MVLQFWKYFFVQALSTSGVLVSTLDQGWEGEMILRKFIRENYIFRQEDPLRMKSRFLLMQKVDFQILQSEKGPFIQIKSEIKVDLWVKLD